MTLKFVHPSTVVVSGPTGSGKTQFVYCLIKEEMFSPWPENIVWLYSEWQEIYETVLHFMPHVQFIRGTPAGIYKKFQPFSSNLLVLDDQMCEAGENREILELFTKGSHHRNLSIIFIVQNLFYKGPVMRTISLNTQYYVIFKSPRDKSQIRSMSIQMYPGNSHFLVDSFEDATKEPYGYLVIDLRPETEDAFRVRSNIIPGEETVVYNPDQTQKHRK